MKKIWSKVLYEYVSNKFRTRKRILKKQNEALRKIIEFAFNNSKYYHDSFSQVGVNKENIKTFPINQLPLLNKKIFLDHYDDIFTTNDLSYDKIINKRDKISSQYHIVHSSGSSGKSFHFVYDQKAWDSLIVAAMREIINSFGINKAIKAMVKKTKILYVAMTNGEYAGASVFASSVNKLKLEFKLLDINTPINELTSIAQEFNPDYIMGYPTAISLIINSIMNNPKPRIKGIITTGEILSETKRKFMEDTCRCKIINLYGASESFLIGFEHSNTFYLFDDYTYVEAINNRVYITNLYNYVQPIIRYELSDYIEFIKDKKSQYTKCRIFTGREEDVLWFTSKDGIKEYLHPLMFEDFCFDGLYDYQLIQDNKDHFILTFVTDKPSQTPAIIDFINQNIRNILNGHKLSFVTFDIKQVEQIMPDITTGKKRLTIGLKEDVSPN